MLEFTKDGKIFISLEFITQHLFKIGVIIFSLDIITLIAYLVGDWLRSEKGDR